MVFFYLFIYFQNAVNGQNMIEKKLTVFEVMMKLWFFYTIKLKQQEIANTEIKS